MLCPFCKCEMRHENPHYTFENDDAPDKKTRLFMETDFVCRNKACISYGMKQEKKRVEIPTE